MNRDMENLEPEFNLPEGRESFRIWEVARIWSHSKDQIIELMDIGKFGQVIDCGTGRKSSVIIPRAGLVKFLRENSK